MSTFFSFNRNFDLEETLSSLIRAESFRRLKQLKPICLFTVDSTQDYLSLVLKSETEGELVISEIQTQGRGREGRPWISDRGGLWLSVTLTPDRPELASQILPLSARSVVEAFSRSGLPRCKVKEPNDVICGGKKIAGMLLDSLVKGNRALCYLGIGINLNNRISDSEHESIRHIATSYLDETRTTIPRELFAAGLLQTLDLYYSALNEEPADGVSSVSSSL